MKKFVLAFILALALPVIGGASLQVARGEEDASPEAWFTVEEEDGGVAVTGLDREKTGDCERVVIPSQIGGKQVVAIGDYAFSGRAELTEAVVPEGVRRIGRKAFSGCSALSNVSLPAGLESIGDFAFSGCSKLANVAIPEGVARFKSYVFQDCPGLTSVVIPKSVEEILFNAFLGTSVAFAVDSENANYSSENGVLFDKNKERLLYVPNAISLKSYEIPDTVKEIGDLAFRDCSLISSVAIPESVSAIGEKAFLRCPAEFKVKEGSFGAGWAREKEVKRKQEEESASPEEWFKTEDVDGGVAIVGLNYEKAREKIKKAKKMVIPSQIGGKLVVEIGRSAFSHSSLTSVVIPESVKIIRGRAFEFCRALKRVVIPEGVKRLDGDPFHASSALLEVDPKNVNYSSEDGVLFDKNKKTLLHFPTSESFKSYSIPDGVETIGEDAFCDCSTIENVVIPESVKIIGDYAFVGCSSLSSVVIPKGVEEIAAKAFYGCSALFEVDPENANYSSMDGVLFDKDRKILLHFPDNESLKTYSIPDSVESIGAYAFESCDSLTSVVIPMGVKKIGTVAFEGCRSLANLEIPNSVNEIGSSAFGDCRSLTSVVIPKDVKNISSFMFIRCESLTDVEIPEGVESIGRFAFQDCSSLTNVVIPKSVNKIGECAFSICTSLTSVVIPEGVSRIETWTFGDCSSLTSVTIPEGVEIIGEVAFKKCASLKTLDIPKSVQEISDDAFEECSAKLRVFKGSYAETWAREHEREYETIESDVASGAAAASPEGWFETKEVEGGVAIAGFTSAGANHSYIVIPSEIGGKAVVEIGEKAFERTGVKSVVIPKGVRSIGVEAFRDCRILKNVDVPNTAKTSIRGRSGIVRGLSVS